MWAALLHHLAFRNTAVQRMKTDGSGPHARASFIRDTRAFVVGHFATTSNSMLITLLWWLDRVLKAVEVRIGLAGILECTVSHCIPCANATARMDYVCSSLEIVDFEIHDISCGAPKC